MRVRLTYTVEEDKVLGEAAKLIGLCTEDVQNMVHLFNNVQLELAAKKEEEEAGLPAPVNTPRVMQMLEDFREEISNLDTRLFEVMQIVDGYERYMQSKRDESTPSSLATDELNSPVPEEVVESE